MRKQIGYGSLAFAVTFGWSTNAQAWVSAGESPLMKMISPKCENRHIPPIPSSTYSTPATKEADDAKYEAEWAAYREKDEDCYIYSPESKQLLLIETEKHARARLAQEGKVVPRKLGWDAVLPKGPYAMFFTPSTPPPSDAQSKSQKRPQPDTKKMPHEAAAPPVKEDGGKGKAKVFRVDRGLLVCDAKDIDGPEGGLTADVFPENKLTEAALRNGIAIKPKRPVEVLGFPLIDIYAKTSQKARTYLIGGRVTGDADNVNRELHKLHSKSPAATLTSNVSGTRNKSLGVRYTTSLKPPPGAAAKKLTLKVEQATGAAFTDILCVGST